MRIIPKTPQNNANPTTSNLPTYENSNTTNDNQSNINNTTTTTTTTTSTTTPTTTPVNHVSSSAITLNSASSTLTTNSSKHYTAKNVNNSDSNDDGYNSSDEYEQASKRARITPSDQSEKVQHIDLYQLMEMERKFEQDLQKSAGFQIKKMSEDGNCLFRAIADQIYGDAEMHSTVRKMVMDYMVAERDHYSQFVTEDFDEYIKRKRQDKCFGNHTEMQAMAEMYNRPIEVYSYGIEPINIFHGVYAIENFPIRLSYHRNNHYNSVIDPESPSVGVGLGLPNYNPKEQQKEQMQKILTESEQDVLEKQLVEECKKQSELEAIESEFDNAVEKSIIEQFKEPDYLQFVDLEETELAIEQAILESSRAEYFKSLLQQNQ